MAKNKLQLQIYLDNMNIFDKFPQICAREIQKKPIHTFPSWQNIIWVPAY